MFNIARQVFNIIAVGLCGRPSSGPLRVSWAVTYRCNSACKMCKRVELDDGRAELNFEEARDFIEQCAKAGVANLSYTGGEPLLRDDLFELNKFAKAKGIPVTTATTNGIFLDNFLERIANAGFSLLSISLDASDKETYRQIRGIDAFERVVKNIADLVKVRNASRSSLKIAVNTVINAKNYHQLPDITAIIKQTGVDSFNFGPVNHIPQDGYFVPGDFDFGSYCQKQELQRIIIDLLRDKSLKLRAGKRFYLGIPEFIFEKENTRIIPCWATHLSFFVDPYGDIYPCNGRMAFLGNLREISLRDAWLCPAMSCVRKQVSLGNHPLCWMSCYEPFRKKRNALLLANLKYTGLL